MLRRPSLFPPMRNEPPSGLDQFKLAGSRVSAEDRDTRGRNNVEAPTEGTAVSAADVPGALNRRVVRADVVAAHVPIVTGWQCYGRDDKGYPVRRVDVLSAGGNPFKIYSITPSRTL